MVQATLESGDRNEADSAPLATIERQAARARRTACAVLRFLQSLRRSHTALPISPHTGHLHNVSPSSGEVQTAASRPHARGVRDPCSAQPPPVCHCTTLVLCALHSCSHPHYRFRPFASPIVGRGQDADPFSRRLLAVLRSHTSPAASGDATLPCLHWTWTSGGHS